MDALTADRDASVGSTEPMKTLIVGCGTSGTAAVTHAKAEAQESQAIAYLGVDVMPHPPAVFQNVNGTLVETRFEPDLEYIRIGTEFDPPHALATLRSHPGRNESLLWLLEKQSQGSPVASVEMGTEAQRALAFAAFLWSRAEIEHRVELALRRLNDVRLKTGAGQLISNAAINVVVVGSIAGGVGSAIAFPIASLIKGKMSRLGIATHRSLFTYVAIGPDAFPETGLRIANAFGALRDLELAQKKGVVVCD